MVNTNFNKYNRILNIIAVIISVLCILVQGTTYLNLDALNKTFTFIPFFICLIAIIILLIFLKIKSKSTSLSNETLLLILALYGILNFGISEGGSGGGVSEIFKTGQYVFNNHGVYKYISYHDYKVFNSYSARAFSAIVMFVIWAFVSAKHSKIELKKRLFKK